ncbi:MAG: ACT domain-containing protein [Paludibacter sp.]|nr:ACT domain-containing protein [Paludibacter sp.]
MVIKSFTEELSVCKVQNISQIDFSDEFCFLGKTNEEISVVCLTNKVPENAIQRDDGWKMFRIEGELDFSLIGVLSKISAILAEREIGIFAISTYNTDYILTKSENYQKALSCLKNAGYQIKS